MIIKMTVKDNDFGNLMSGFVLNLGIRISQLPLNIKELDGERQLEIIKELKMLDRLLNPNITEQHTDEEKKLLVKRITEVFSEYVNKPYVCGDEDTAAYLIRNFKVEIVNSMEDKWENGEMFYWFQHSRTVINQ